jgi:hypothetical protein
MGQSTACANRLALALAATVAGLVVSSCAVGVRQPATSITATSATLNGKVLSTSGGPGSYFIEYGLTQARSEKTPTRPITFTVNTIYPVSEPVEGLDPGRLYHFAVCAEDSENPGDPFCSPDQTFTTEFDPQTDHVSAQIAEESCAENDCVTTVTTVVAISGPSGENPTGISFVTIDGEQWGDFGDVTCLRVSGNRAVVGLEVDIHAQVAHAILFVEDSTPDRFRFTPAAERVTSCPPFSNDNLSATSDIVVHDAPAPSS